MPYDLKAAVSKVPPPDKLGTGKADPVEPDADDAEVDNEIRVSNMQDFAKALGLKITPEQAQAACEALDAYNGA